MKESLTTHSISKENKSSARKVARNAFLASVVTLSAPSVVLAENQENDESKTSPLPSPIVFENSEENPDQSLNLIYENDAVSLLLPEKHRESDIPKLPEDFYPAELELENENLDELSPEIEKKTEKQEDSKEKEKETKNKTYKKNLFEKDGYVRQPDSRTCVAAATQMMLNFDENRKKSDWRLNTSSKKTYQIFKYARAKDTLDPSGVGSDANGWDEALEKFGGFDEEVYEIRAYKRRVRAIKDSVMAIARTGKPVGMVGWAGKHAQVITGYIVEGGDPEDTRHFKVKAVFLSDPLAASNMKNEKVTFEELTGGRFKDTLSPYRERDSHNKNGKPIWKKWYNKYTLIMPTE